MGCEFQDKKLSAFQQEREVYVFRPQGSFTVVASEPIEGLQVGGVIIKREQDGALFAAILAPFKKLNEGEQIKVLYISCVQELGTPVEFLAVE